VHRTIGIRTVARKSTSKKIYEYDIEIVFTEKQGVCVSFLRKWKRKAKKTRSTIELFKTEMLEQVVETKDRIDLLNERKVRDLQTTIKSLEEKFEVQQQMA